jgi:hypothetical protein
MSNAEERKGKERRRTVGEERVLIGGGRTVGSTAAGSTND